ncbi:uncharacterized protein C8Q71DRAFT_717950 [Rhodofomes roseus]|uniref:Uncharacterized protein n=1 Tax=Rhodofomes roseus TaxID=34475 RepID=A0ABQ8JZY0_9APHY|nr:uncharacterized protein C8Q71DRAFT_717950 [Rhodofomes roseus]KAH9829640.1 hypothetical protein C8Q71DRAFT_717950 [Rhodofomes roseus]
MSVAQAPGTLTNRTIDDYYGDSVTGLQPQYRSGSAWNYGPQCPGCFIQPAADEAFDQSWHDVTASPNDPGPSNVTLTFTGTAVWVYGVVPNYVQYATTFVNVSFELDGKVAGLYTHVPSTSTSYEYNVTLFSNTGLANTQHTLVISPQREPDTSYMAFDWAQYTYDVTTSSSTGSSTSSTASGGGSSSTSVVQSPSQSASGFTSTSSHAPVGAIVGGVIGGLGLLALVILVLLLHRRYRHGGLDKIRIVRGGEEGRGCIEPGAQVDPFVDPSMSQVNAPGASLGPQRGHKKGTSSTSLYVLPVDTPAASRDALALPPSNTPGSAAPTSAAPPTDSPASAIPRSARRPNGRGPKASMRREELSRQMRDIESAVADLRRRQSAQSARTVSSRPASGPIPPLPGSPELPPESDDSDELRRQIEALQLEVERLRMEQDVTLSEPPPAYVYEQEDREARES